MDKLEGASNIIWKLIYYTPINNVRTKTMLSILVFILVVILICGLVSYVVNMIVPLDPMVRNLVNAIIWIIALLLILQRALPVLGVSI
jgi:hypothetical protein